MEETILVTGFAILAVIWVVIIVVEVDKKINNK